MEVGGLIPPVPPDNFSEPKLKHIMKVELNENKEVNERPFPKLMIGSLGSIVLMESAGKGVRLTKPKLSATTPNQGHFYEKLDMSCFQDFNGSITLSNE